MVESAKPSPFRWTPTLDAALDRARSAFELLAIARDGILLRESNPALDSVLRRAVLERSVHELSGALEAARNELGDQCVPIVATVEQPEKAGDRMTRYQRAQFGVAPIEPSSLDVARAFGPLSPPRREPNQPAGSFPRPTLSG